MRSFGVLLAVFGLTYATTGFDAIDPLTIAKFQCMKQNGHSFYIARVFRSSGSVDTTGVSNMNNAWAGGMSRVDGYIFPCVTCSTTPAQQADAAYNAVKGVKYGMLWLDIEIYKWSADHTTNRNFITAFGNELTRLGVNWGVYSSYNNWQNIVGLDWTALSSKPLWWATYNNQANFNNFKAFGGWTKPSIHQYAGDVAGPCSFNTDYNWLVVFAALFGVSLATLGFDAIDPISVSRFQCMKQNGHSFYISRVFRSNGQIDQTGLTNMQNAWSGGMSHVDAYIFPCVSCSATPAAQVDSTINAIKNAGVKYGMIWLDIEIYQWSSSQTTNRNFITAMANELNARSINWGVYSSANNWQSIVGADWTGLSNKPLWWATYNGQANFNNFKPFGGWTAPAIHQYAGDVNGPCSFNTDYNWYP